MGVEKIVRTIVLHSVEAWTCLDWATAIHMPHKLGPYRAADHLTGRLAPVAFNSVPRTNEADDR